MLHEQLDISYWKQVFALTKLRAEGEEPDDFNITGPRSIAVIEQLREEAFTLLPDIEKVPTDIFILNQGEPTQRACTKMSGLPFRAAKKPWPLAPSGKPMNFVAQFCFADSRDLLPSLPGDVLLIFIEGKEWRYRQHQGYELMWGNGDHRDSAVTFEWVSLDEHPLISAEEIPETPWKIEPFYGTIYRTWDYTNTDGFAYPHIAAHIATSLEAMKIGGDYPSPWIPQHDLGIYLCTLNSIFFENGPYPFLNLPKPISATERRNNAETYLKIGDMGLMNIFLHPDGSIRWVADG